VSDAQTERNTDSDYVAETIAIGKEIDAAWEAAAR